MKNAGRGRGVLLLFLSLGLACALLLCGLRMGVEANNTEVQAVMSESDLAALGAANGLTAAAAAEAIGVTAAAPAALEDGQLLVEDQNQYSYDPAYGDYDPTLPAVRVFLLDGAYAARYGTLGYAGGEELENMLYRAVTDRNIRVVWLTPFVDAKSGDTVTDLGEYRAVLERLGQRIAAHGLRLSQTASQLRPYTPNPVLLCLCAVSVAAAAVFLLLSLLPAPCMRLALPLLALGAALALGLLLFAERWFVPVFALGASVSFPCLAAVYMVNRMKAAAPALRGRELGQFARALLGGLGLALAGGVFVGALQSGAVWLLAVENFTGVKLSQALPLALSAALVLWKLCTPGEILKGKKALAVLAVLAVAAAAAVFLARTGNRAGAVSVLEQRFRNLLETALIARPRTKELLVGWPCLAAAFLFLFRGRKQLAWPFAIFSVVACSSVVNTFCHSRAPLWLSLTRSLLGALIGCAIGLVLLCLFHKPREKR